MGEAEWGNFNRNWFHGKKRQMTLSHLKVRKFEVKAARVVRGEVWAIKGDIVYEFKGHDYGLARDDTLYFGIEHISVTEDAKGAGSSFTIPLHNLKEIPNDEETT